MGIGDALLVSIRVTGMAGIAIFVVGLPLSIFLARRRGVVARIVEMAVLLPMLLPPTVVGYFLLKVLGNASPLSSWLGLHLLFTVWGAAVAGTVAGLPLMVLSSRAAISQVDRRLEDVARTLGAGELEVLWDITLPLALRGVVAGMLMAIARATGEFGATLMVAGSIPGRTRTMSIALYEAIQLGDQATALGIVLLLTGLVVLVVTVLRSLGSGLS